MNLIVAVDKNHGIGKEQKLLYHIPDDLQFFKEKTLNKVMILGYNTLLSLPKSKPLPNRHSIVISKDRVEIEGAEVCTSLEELFYIAKKYNSDDLFVIGGASVYEQLAEYCNYAYITEIDAEADADTFFHKVYDKSKWEKVSESETQFCNGFEFKYCKYKNLQPKPFI